MKELIQHYAEVKAKADPDNYKESEMELVYEVYDYVKYKRDTWYKDSWIGGKKKDGYGPWKEQTREKREELISIDGEYFHFPNYGDFSFGGHLSHKSEKENLRTEIRTETKIEGPDGGYLGDIAEYQKEQLELETLLYAYWERNVKPSNSEFSLVGNGRVISFNQWIDSQLKELEG